MSRIPRAALFALLAVVLVVSFVLARSAGDSSDDEGTNAAVSTPTTAPAATTSAPAATTSTPSTTSTPTATTPAPAPAPAVPVLRAGKVTKLRATKGDQVRFRVAAKAADEVHVHGYDKMYDLAAGETRTITFKATIEGIFEIEFEDAGEQIASLRVDP